MKSFMRCDMILEMMNDIIDGEASFMKRMGFYFHLSMCSNCRVYFRQYREMRSKMNVVLPEDLPDDFFEVMQSVVPRGALPLSVEEPCLKPSSE
ncbi:MAG: zf-HC2 domain-containing protein [Myxococcota bacterium]